MVNYISIEKVDFLNTYQNLELWGRHGERGEFLLLETRKVNFHTVTLLAQFLIVSCIALVFPAVFAGSFFVQCRVEIHPSLTSLTAACLCRRPSLARVLLLPPTDNTVIITGPLL